MGPDVRLVALLRAVNLGPATQVPMARLRAVAEGLGHRDVGTHLRSGNLVFTATAADPEAIAATLAEALAGAFGFDIPVLLRTRDEIAEVLADDPFGGLVTDPARHVVVFLDDPVEPAEVRALLPADTGVEAVHVTPRHIHVWTPLGVSRSQVLTALGRRRGPATRGTVRNRRTVEAILALCEAGGRRVSPPRG